MEDSMQVIESSQSATPRPVSWDTAQLVVRVGYDLLAEFDAVVEALGMTRSEYVRRIVSDTVLLARAGSRVAA
jgi:hypothetical protein